MGELAGKFMALAKALKLTFVAERNRTARPAARREKLFPLDCPSPMASTATAR